ncbi:MAG TPA: alpha/beta hydrolase [Candidatus Limnocylindrales bacterium]|nr:alpha/beta hydrolase [Candidatus Limnocylindrales bacterium]
MPDTTQALHTVTSVDGTTIAYDRLGDGPPVVLVSGGSTDRMANAALAAALAPGFTVFNYDRRGRGPSGDTPPYAVAREVEDIAAVIEAAGGSAHLYGTSSGAALALEAAASGVPLRKLALWEPPWFVDPAQRPPLDSADTYRRFVAEGRRDKAVEYFMADVVRLPAEFVAFAKTQPWWAGQEAIAHTLAYDAEVMGDYLIPTDRARKVAVPTIILTGGDSFPFFRETADAVAGIIPDARTGVLEAQEHNVDPQVIGAALAEFFAS